jgi:hypothetical protein
MAGLSGEMRKGDEGGMQQWWGRGLGAEEQEQAAEAFLLRGGEDVEAMRV